MIGKKILAFVALSGLVASTLAAPVVETATEASANTETLLKRSGSVIVDLKYFASQRQSGKTFESSGLITASATQNGATLFSSTKDIGFLQQFPSETCFDSDGWCVRITTTDSTCNFYYWDRNQQFSYNPVKARVVGNQEDGDYSFSCEMNWQAN